MKEKKNIENFKRELLAKYLSNEVSSREKLEVESWVNLSEKNQVELNECQQMLEKVDVFYKTKSFNSSAAWNNVHSIINSPQLTVVGRNKLRKEAIARFYKYAAIIVIAILLGFVGYYIGFKNNMPTVFTEIKSAENQVLNEYELPDGTLVTLNSNSQLTFPKSFNNDAREVTISGEAFFDVTPDPKKPFIINTENAQLKVLGTSFNVCAYPNSEKLVVVVKTGKVQVNGKKDDLVCENQHIFLLPGEKGTFFTRSKTLEKSANTDVNYFAWKTHELIFNEVPLSDVINSLKKVYNINVLVAEPELNNLLLTAHFDKKPVDFVLNVIRLTFNLELAENNEQFIFSSHNE